MFARDHLGRLIFLDAATIKGVVDRLGVRNFVTALADPKDRRRRGGALTDRGREVTKAAIAVAAEITTETLEPLSVEDRRVVCELLKKLSYIRKASPGYRPEILVRVFSSGTQSSSMSSIQASCGVRSAIIGCGQLLAHRPRSGACFARIFKLADRRHRTAARPSRSHRAQRACTRPCRCPADAAAPCETFVIRLDPARETCRHGRW